MNKEIEQIVDVFTKEHRLKHLIAEIGSQQWNRISARTLVCTSGSDGRLTLAVARRDCCSEVLDGVSELWKIVQKLPSAQKVVLSGPVNEGDPAVHQLCTMPSL